MQIIQTNANPPGPSDASTTCACPTICPTTNNAVLVYPGPPFPLAGVSLYGEFDQPLFAGTIPQGGNNFWGASQTVFHISGFQNSVNNGRFLCHTSTAASLLCVPASLSPAEQIPETTAAFAIPLILGGETPESNQVVSAEEFVGSSNQSTPGESSPLRPVCATFNLGGIFVKFVNPA
jgi:hypothetical protein